jgi:hypothetical protein
VGRKQDLLLFMEENLNGENFLNCDVLYIQQNANGKRKFLTTKEKALIHIENLFDEELVGHSGDNIMIEILD